MTNERERIGVGTAGSVLFVAAVAVGGLVLGLVVGWAGEWLAAQSWLPAQGVVDRVVSVAEDAAWWARAGVGLVAGALAGAALLTQSTLVEVGPGEIRVVGGGTRERRSRAQVAAVVLEGRRLSLRDTHDADLVSEKVDCDVDRLSEALERHGWPVTRD